MPMKAPHSSLCLVLLLTFGVAARAAPPAQIPKQVKLNDPLILSYESPLTGRPAKMLVTVTGMLPGGELLVHGKRTVVFHMRGIARTTAVSGRIPVNHLVGDMIRSTDIVDLTIKEAEAAQHKTPPLLQDWIVLESSPARR
jgi:hypothetical protein